MMSTNMSERLQSAVLLDVLIRMGLIAVMVMYCFEVFRPFLNLTLWSVILAITLYPLHLWVRERMGQRDSRAATLIATVSVSALLIPIIYLGLSLTSSVHASLAAVSGDGLKIPAPAESVATWPLIGPKLYSLWAEASTNLGEFAHQFAPQIKAVSVAVLGRVSSLGLGLILFLFALVLAAVIMAYGELGKRSAIRIFSRISGSQKGPEIAGLCTATIRAVALGVVGIAFIQMLLIGLGLAIKGVPAAGVLALAVMLLGIMQLPATLITIPVIGFVFVTEGANTSTIVFAIYIFIAGLVDNVLKPLLLGRGVSVPMPVVLVGALGGMMSSGIVGLFIGPVLLAVGYRLFWQWVDDQPQPPVAGEQEPAGTESGA